MATKHSGILVLALSILVTHTTRITSTEMGSTMCSAAFRTSSVGEIPISTNTASSPEWAASSVGDLSWVASTWLVSTAAASAAAASSFVRSSSSRSLASRPCSASSRAAFFLMRSSSSSRSTAELTSAAAVAAALAAAAAAAAALAVAVLIWAFLAIWTDSSTSSNVSDFTPTSPVCFDACARGGAAVGWGSGRGAESASCKASCRWRRGV
mmetsp:Transcript_16727/g.37005  ORF Transcript_16727/g.37005 Transcript_16727/m.37005 type:complete len:211 (+) Transcript_16727:1409-2041(+)